ncbi:hypothetical protein I553_3881 [Mycobacterium xenopi 4042]|uniref:Uncharacterized protein n=1 Tax=Mycobacterium xenopi 4042 TaxID=1299334 RepID=X8ED53_MYCXE|nr:hypothetical protein I553_3881 [Mycobacterium xenopi 4042]
MVLRLTVASDCTDTEVRGTLTLVCPTAGCRPRPAAGDAAPGEYRETDVAVAMPGDRGRLYPIRAQLRITATGCLAHGDKSWKTCARSPSSPNRPATGVPRRRPTDVELAAGACARLSVVVGTDAHAPLAIEAHLISPWGTWDGSPRSLRRGLAARGTVSLGFDVTHRRGPRRRMVGPGPGWCAGSCCTHPR